MWCGWKMWVDFGGVVGIVIGFAGAISTCRKEQVCNLLKTKIKLG